MARILVADDELSIRIYVEETLQEQGHEVHTADSPAQALPLAEFMKFDLVVSDVNMPGMNGFAFRNALHMLPGAEAVPFLYMSGADAVAEQAIARELGTDRLLLKPFSIPDLLREVAAFLGKGRTERAAVPEGLAAVLERIRAGGETGMLTAVEERIAKRFVFRKGALIFALSNDPHDLIGQAMLRTSVITEADLREALAAIAQTATGGSARGPGLAGALTAMRKLSTEQCQKTFVGKIRESLLDAFIWDGGQAEFVSGDIGDSEAPFPVAIELPNLITEGARRCERWKAIRPKLPAGTDTLEKVGDWPADFPKNAGDQLLARQLERELTFDGLLLELRGQRYAVGVKVVDLLHRGVLEAVRDGGFSGALPQEPTPEEVERARLELELEGLVGAAPVQARRPAATPAPVVAPPAAPPPAVAPDVKSNLLSLGLLRMRAGEIAEAREVFLDVLKLDPLDALARRRLEEAEQALAAASRGRGLRDDTVVRLAVPVSTLVGRKIAPNEAFVLSRLAAGKMTVRELMHVCPLPENEILGVLERSIPEGIIERL